MSEVIPGTITMNRRSNLHTIKGPALCDNNVNARCYHFAVTVHLQMTKPSKGRITITFRKLRGIEFTKFKPDLRSTDTLTQLCRSLDKLFNGYIQELRTFLNQHASDQTRSITLRPITPWYTDKL